MLGSSQLTRIVHHCKIKLYICILKCMHALFYLFENTPKWYDDLLALTPQLFDAE